MTPTEQHLNDKRNAEQYATALTNLTALEALLHDLAVQTYADRPAFYTFAEPVRNLWTKTLEDMAAKVHDMCEQAQGLEAAYGSLVAKASA